MAEPHCFPTLQLCALRVAKLLATGSPDDGTSNGYVTDALIKADIAVELEEGDDFTLKNGCGGICATFKDCDRVKRVNVDLELCNLDSALLSLLIGGTHFTDLAGAGVGNSIGYQLPDFDDPCPAPVSLEMWTKAWDGSVQATPPFAGGATNVYYHFVMPLCRFQLGDMTLENEFAHVPVSGFSQDNSKITSNGPFDDWPNDVRDRGGITTSLGWFMDSVLPTATCGFINVPSLAS